MTELDLLLLLAAIAVPLSALLATRAAGRWLLVAAYIAQLVLLIVLEPGEGARSTVGFTLLGNPVGWQLDALGWFTMRRISRQLPRRLQPPGLMASASWQTADDEMLDLEPIRQLVAVLQQLPGFRPELVLRRLPRLRRRRRH